MTRIVRRLLVPIGFALLASVLHAGQIGLLSKAATLSDTALGSDFPRVSNPVFSADGRWVAFTSTAVNLVPGQDPHVYLDLFLQDRQTGTTVLVNHAAGSPTVSASGGSPEEHSISDDGRWIVYASTAWNLVENQVQNPIPLSSQVFLYDRETGANTLLSHSVQGASISSNDLATSPHISGDGSWIVFESAATDLLAGQSDTPGTRDVFLQERATGQRILVSRATGASLTAANQPSGSPSVSDDGRWVAFRSGASNLIPGFSPLFPSGGVNVYLFDRVTGAMTLASHTSASATTGAGDTRGVSKISPDGAAVLYGSISESLVAGQIDTYGTFDLFLFDRASGTNVLVSHADSSPAASGGAMEGNADVAAGGAWVVFARFMDSVGGQIYLFRRADSTVTLVSHSIASPTQIANRFCWGPRITPDGAFALFESTATDLVPGQSGAWYNVFLFDRAAGTLALVSGVDGSGQAGGNDASFIAGIDDGGSAVAYYTRATDLDSGTADLNGIIDLAVYDRASAASTYATLHAPGQASATPSADSTLVSASADGRYAVFLGAAPNVVPGQVDGRSQDVFLVDRTAGTATLVSHAAGQTATAGDGGSSNAAISGDGNYIAFASTARNLVPGQIDTNYAEDYEGNPVPGADVFLYDRIAGTTTLVSHAAGSDVTAGDDDCPGEVSLSADGRYVTFSSYADNLVPGQTDTGQSVDVFLYDRVSGTTTLVSRKAGTAATAANGYSATARISGDGRWVGFYSGATDLVAGETDANSLSDVFLFDRVSGQTLLVSRAAGTAATAANQRSWNVALNPDGRYLVFSSLAGNLVPGQSGPQSQNVFLFDRVSGTVELISRAAGTATTTVSDAQDSLISDDGRCVAFRSAAPNLVPGQTAGPGGAKQNVFVHDRVTRQTELISRSLLSPLQTSNGGAQQPVLSPDGRYVAFLSLATDLAAGATGRDIHLADRQLHTLERVAPGTREYFNDYSGLPFPSPRLSADGSVVLFTSAGPDLAPADYNAADDVFAWVRSAPGTGDFFTIAPCRLIDTRQAGQGPALASGVPALLTVHGACGIPGIPGKARAIAINVTVLQAQGDGRLTLHPGNLSTPNTSTINFTAGQTLANNAILALASNGEGTLAITPVITGGSGGGTVHVIVDVSGWFE
jgi:Tol biopolymer transport system component